MKNLIGFFAKQHLFSNFLFIIIVVGGVFFWQHTGKEELPEMALDFVRISVVYPGAAAGEVERFVTWPIEKELRGLTGIEGIESSSDDGRATITVELIRNLKDRNAVIAEIRNEVLSVKLPDEVRELPTIREFKSTIKAVVDVALYIEGTEILDDVSRRRLQRITHRLENRLLALPEVNSLTMTGYLKEELRILLNPVSLTRYRMPVHAVHQAIDAASQRRPAGSLESRREERITLDGELDRPEKLMALPVQGTFEGGLVRLGQVATVQDTFEENSSVTKVNGHEGVIMMVRKNSRYGIIEAVDAVKTEVARFNAGLTDFAVRVVLLDDESAEVRNRLSIIGSNGILGFILIVMFLMLFMNLRAGFWVAMGIPFTFGFTMIVAGLMGYTINNSTLAGVIIVMGMVVDDAIVVAENVMRLRSQGMPMTQAVVEGTSYVLLPITASIFTTIAAFMPLMAMEGRLGALSGVIPPIVAIMLLGSLLEALIVLPAHLGMKVPRWVRMLYTLGTLPLWERLFHGSKNEGAKAHWFEKIESRYAALLAPVLRYRMLIIIFFLVLTATGSAVLFKVMKFEIFPREESTRIKIMAKAPAGTRKYTTARLARRIEDVLIPYVGDELVGFRTQIARSMRANVARENTLMMRIELVEADQRDKSLKELMREWQAEIDKIEGFDTIRFSMARFGMDSGSPIEVIIQENDNAVRDKAATALMTEMKKSGFLKNIESGEPYRVPEYRMVPKRDIIQRLGVSTSRLGQTLRTVVQGTVLYEILVGDEEKDITLAVPESSRRTIQSVLAMPVSTSEEYMIPLGQVVTLQKGMAPAQVQRIDAQRATRIYADIIPGSGTTPLEVAAWLEGEVFPRVNEQVPGAVFSFDGEIKLSRESTGFFQLAAVMVLFLIYFILALQFGSMTRPLIIMAAIPPALASVGLIFYAHGMQSFGFYGVIGAIGLSGVVVNDAIVMVRKLEDDVPASGTGGLREIATTAASRLRAITLTTLTTVAGLFPTAYGIFGYDSMLAEMMLALSWGLIAGTIIILMLVPSLYAVDISLRRFFRGEMQ